MQATHGSVLIADTVLLNGPARGSDPEGGDVNALVLGCGEMGREVVLDLFVRQDLWDAYLRSSRSSSKTWRRISRPLRPRLVL